MFKRLISKLKRIIIKYNSYTQDVIDMLNIAMTFYLTRQQFKPVFIHNTNTRLNIEVNTQLAEIYKVLVCSSPQQIAEMDFLK